MKGLIWGRVEKYHMSWENDQHGTCIQVGFPLFSILCASSCPSSFFAAVFTPRNARQWFPWRILAWWMPSCMVSPRLPSGIRKSPAKPQGRCSASWENGWRKRRFSLAWAWEDFDNDGDQDLHAVNDFGLDNFYLNEGPDADGQPSRRFRKQSPHKICFAVTARR